MINLIKTASKIITIASLLLIPMGIILNLSAVIIPISIVGGMVSSFVWVECYKAIETKKLIKTLVVLTR